MKKLNLLFATLLVSSVALAANLVPIRGFDTELAATQAQADSSANAGALGYLNGNCMGPIVNRQKTSDQCSNIGTASQPTYSCTVTYVGQCQQ